MTNRPTAYCNCMGTLSEKAQRAELEMEDGVARCLQIDGASVETIMLCNLTCLADEAADLVLHITRRDNSYYHSDTGMPSRSLVFSNQGGTVEEVRCGLVSEVCEAMDQRPDRRLRVLPERGP